jgi:hypothetical protein
MYSTTLGELSDWFFLLFYRLPGGMRMLPAWQPSVSQRNLLHC